MEFLLVALGGALAAALSVFLRRKTIYAASLKDLPVFYISNYIRNRTYQNTQTG